MCTPLTGARPWGGRLCRTNMQGDLARASGGRPLTPAPHSPAVASRHRLLILQASSPHSCATACRFRLARALGCGTRLTSDCFEAAGQLFRIEVYPNGVSPGECAWCQLTAGRPRRPH